MSHAVLAAAATGFKAPDVNYAQLSPILIVFGVAVVAVLVEAFVSRRWRYVTQLVLSLGGVIAALVAVVLLAGTHTTTASGAVAIDGPGLFLEGTILALALVSLLLIAERQVDAAGDAFAPRASAVPGSRDEQLAIRAGVSQTEVFPLTLFAIGGMLVFPTANDLLTMFIGLEVLSLPLYLLSGLARRRRLISQEAALKYFLLGAFSSAFFLFGIAMLYGYSGSVSLTGIAQAVSNTTTNDVLGLLGIALVSVGLLFKAAAVPFQAWTPDVYQGAPTPITGFMAACTKVAAFGALLRVYFVALGGMAWDWRPMIAGIAILTMLVGAVVALTQTDIKRMLAYSSIAHAGFVLTAVLAVNAAGRRGVLFYLLAYGFMTLGAFAIVTLVRDSGGEATHLSQWAGLGKRAPVVATVFSLFLLAMAGIPLTSGFMSKYAVFSAALGAGAQGLGVAVVIVGVLASAIAAFFYVRVIVLMFFSEPAVDGPTVAVPSALTTVAVTVGAAVTLVLGIVPQPVLDLAARAGDFIH